MYTRGILIFVKMLSMSMNLYISLIPSRGLFNWFSYLFFFYNGFAGFIGAVMRSLMASIFSLLLLFRLDTVVLMRGFERFDYGISATFSA